jgi:hypothetical protein
LQKVGEHEVRGAGGGVGVGCPDGGAADGRGVGGQIIRAGAGARTTGGGC